MFKKTPDTFTAFQLIFDIQFQSNITIFLSIELKISPGCFQLLIDNSNENGKKKK